MEVHRTCRGRLRRAPACYWGSDAGRRRGDDDRGATEVPEADAGAVLGADRAGRGRLLDEMAAVTGLHRKSLLRLLAPGGLDRWPRRQRGRVYGHLVDDALRVIWESLDYVCAEALTPALLATARAAGAHGEVRLTDEPGSPVGADQHRERATPADAAGAGHASPPAPGAGAGQPRQPGGAPDPDARLAWDEARQGTSRWTSSIIVGRSPTASTCTRCRLVDVATGWSERVAVLGAASGRWKKPSGACSTDCPSPSAKLHPDNGGEFLNNHLVRFWGEASTGLTLSRSRPYQKNDNRFVEQKNDTLVRAYLGHGRLDTPAQADALNALYDQMWTYYNLFQPVLHLVAKTIDPAEPTQVRRTWDARADAVRAPVRRAGEAVGRAPTRPGAGARPHQPSGAPPGDLRGARPACSRHRRCRPLKTSGGRPRRRKRGSPPQPAGGRALPATNVRNEADAHDTKRKERPRPVAFSFEGTVPRIASSVTFSFDLTRPLVPGERCWPVPGCGTVAVGWINAILAGGVSVGGVHAGPGAARAAVAGRRHAVSSGVAGGERS